MTQGSIEDAFKECESSLSLTGIWPHENTSCFYKIKKTISWLATLFFFAFMTMDTVYNITDFIKFSEIAYVNISIAAHLTKLIVLSFKSKTLFEAVELLRSPMLKVRPDEFDKFGAKTVYFSNIVSQCFRYGVGCCVIWYAIYPVLDNRPYPIPFPYELGKYSIAMYIIQVIGVGMTAWNNAYLDLLILSLIGIANTQFDMLTEKIISIKVEERKADFDSDTDAEIIKRLKQYVMQHLAILKFVDMIEDIFTIALLSQFICSIFTICNTVFHIVLVNRVNFQLILLINYLTIVIIELFLFCWHGNMLIDKSAAIGDACYFFEWYNCGPEVRKYLYIIMERSNRPSRITTMKFSTLSFQAFASILQWSYSGLALLLKMYEKKKLNQ